MEASGAFYGEIKFPELSFVNYQNWIYIPQNRIVEVDNNFQFQQLSYSYALDIYSLHLSFKACSESEGLILFFMPYAISLL